ncbi:HlyC/CorC family transporter [Verrucomicrobiaceae bacterium N1E253]|uniref:HlyC/CorC family transporter n=1 Tax=Oceaniferula marina TaxID=2748318 RepID=A0A851GHK2_9BACT|nr:hemolysin family protein [Oceaniferula marina]NWK54607.1 HlyC/CorC family transporter [Oceaniferula marina]
MTLLILYFTLSIGFSFLCSIWEAVLLSISPSHINMLEKERPKLGRKIKRMKEEIDRPLSAILSLNTIAHTVGAIGVGAQAGKLYGSESISLGFLHIYYESIIATVMTLAILILSEIIPKTLGATYWKALTPFTIRSVSQLMTFLSPLVWMSQKITGSLKGESTDSVLSRADLAAYAELGEQHGAINSGESRIISNLLKMRTLKTVDIMTPRTVAVMAQEDSTVSEFHQKHQNSPFSRIPIYEEKHDHITGIVLKDDILIALANDNDHTQLKDIKYDAVTVSDSMLLPQLFETMLSKKIHLSIVADQFGSLLGLVTLEDVIETLLGLEIVDETDEAPDLQQLARQKWKERAANLGILPIAEIKPDETPKQAGDQKTPEKAM